MMYETNTPESELARLLAGLPTISQLDVALKAGGLPMNSESRKMIGKNFEMTGRQGRIVNRF